MSAQFTVLGGSGHIGSHLCRWLSRHSIPFSAPERDEPLPGTDLGHVIYAIGLTADFRERPLDAVTAHVTCLVHLLESATFESLLYLSSTRVYQHCRRAEEEVSLEVNPTRPQDLYGISKIMGESACLASGRPGLRVVRLANVYGPDDAAGNFLPSIIWDALREGRVVLRSGLGSEKDYVSISEIVPLLIAIARGGRERVYNVASGDNTPHREIVRIIREETGCRVDVQPGSPDVAFPRIAIERVRREFGFAPSRLSDNLSGLIQAMRERMKLLIDLERRTVSVDDGGQNATHSLSSPQAFSLVSQAWLQCGWDTKYVYTFTWLGRPIIQLPEDLLRIQEVIYALKPDVILETGIAHGGSLVFYAGLCRLMGRGRVVGVDLALRDHNRRAIQQHELASYITLVDGSSVDPEVIGKVHSMITPGEVVLVILDSNHSREHVAQELEAYSDLVSPGSYIVATDGIMRDLVGAPRSATDWESNNPFAAAEDFCRRHPEFRREAPEWQFNESEGLRDAVTYWPGAWLRRAR